jgi:hypothetical protein
MDTKTKINQKMDMVKKDGYGKVIVHVQDHKILYIEQHRIGEPVKDTKAT